MSTIKFVYNLTEFDFDASIGHSYGDHKAMLGKYMTNGDVKSMAYIHFKSGFISGLHMTEVREVDGKVIHLHTFDRQKEFEKGLFTYNVNIGRDLLDEMYKAFTTESILGKGELAMLHDSEVTGNGYFQHVCQLHIEIEADAELETYLKGAFQTFTIEEDYVVGFSLVKRRDPGFVKTSKTAKLIDVSNTLFKSSAPGSVMSAEETRNVLLSGVKTTSSKRSQNLRVASIKPIGDSSAKTNESEGTTPSANTEAMNAAAALIAQAKAKAAAADSSSSVMNLNQAKKEEL